jgi:polysaccharide biosynthesis protein PslH
MARRRLIFVTRRPPFPFDNGARIRTHRLAAGLSGRYDMTLVTFADGPRYDDTECSEEDLARVLPDVSLELLPYARRHPRGPRRGVLRRSSVTFGAYATPGLHRCLARLVDDDPDAVLHLDDPGVALAGIDLPARLKVFAPHNVEYRIVRDLAKEFTPTHRPFWEIEWRRIRAEERRLWSASDLCVAVSDVDAEPVRAEGARRIAVSPNGTDPAAPLPLRPPAAGEPLRLLFVGMALFWPYERGIGWFVREVMPLLRAEGPVTFEVAGVPPENPVQGEGVLYHGRVPEVRSHYERAHALVIPVFEGSGTRLKGVEAAVLGRPVISTRLGMEGLPLRAGEHYQAAETPQEFAAAVDWLRKSLAEDPASVERMTEAARRAVDGFLWPEIAAGLAEHYEEALAAT